MMGWQWHQLDNMQIIHTLQITTRQPHHYYYHQHHTTTILRAVSGTIRVSQCQKKTSGLNDARED